MSTPCVGSFPIDVEFYNGSWLVQYQLLPAGRRMLLNLAHLFYGRLLQNVPSQPLFTFLRNSGEIVAVGADMF